MRAAEDSPFEPRPCLRIAVRADVPAVVDVVNLAFEHEGWLIPGPRLDADVAEHEVVGPLLVTFVATLRDAIVGTVRVRFDDDDGAPREIPELGLLAVHPNARGRGLGALLVRAAEGLAFRAGAGAIELYCGRELGLEPYYLGLGYQRIGEDFGPRYGSYRPFTLVTLRRSLGGPS